jgi:hypothetical protein
VENECVASSMEIRDFMYIVYRQFRRRSTYTDVPSFPLSAYACTPFAKSYFGS